MYATMIAIDGGKAVNDIIVKELLLIIIAMKITIITMTIKEKII